MKKIKIIIDTDIGGDIDDTWALVYALHREIFDVKAICVTGRDLAYKAKLVAKTLMRFNRADIPIIIGMGFPDTETPLANWVSDFPLSDFSGKIYSDTREGFSRLFEDNPDAVLVGLAPNMTLAHIHDLIASKKIKTVAMAGSIFKGYFDSPTPCPECNVVTDMGASKIVYSSNIDYVLLPLDVCGNLILDGENYRQVKGSSAVAARTVMENYLLWDRDYFGGAKKYDVTASSTVLYDLIAFWYLEFPDLIRTKKMKIALDQNGVTYPSKDGMEMEVGLEIKNLPFLYGELTKTLVKE